MTYKVTQGNWEINPKSLRNIRCNERTVANTSSGQSGEFEEEEIANAQLIADAGNTIQKCDLLPSELLEQRDLLLSFVT